MSSSREKLGAGRVSPNQQTAPLSEIDDPALMARMSSLANPEASDKAQFGSPDREATNPASTASTHDSPTAPYSAYSAEQQDAADEDAGADNAEASDAPRQDRDSTRQLDPNAIARTHEQRSLQGLAFAVLRDIGKVRQVNQDSVFALLTTLPRESADVPMGLFVVADGMGGHTNGEVASRLAVRAVAHTVLARLMLPALDDALTESLQQLMIDALQKANTVIWDQAQQTESDMGTTCTAALLLGGSLHIAHVGDSRAYLLDRGRLRLLTDDHSTVGRLIQLGQLDPAEAREHPLRSHLYRTIGQQPDIEVDYAHTKLGAATHILLCSDGLWGMVDEERLRQTLARYVYPQEACNALIDLANMAGGEDNISSVVVTLPVTERQP